MGDTEGNIWTAVLCTYVIPQILQSHAHHAHADPGRGEEARASFTPPLHACMGNRTERAKPSPLPTELKHIHTRVATDTHTADYTHTQRERGEVFTSRKVTSQRVFFSCSVSERCLTACTDHYRRLRSACTLFPLSSSLTPPLSLSLGCVQETQHVRQVADPYEVGIRPEAISHSVS